MQTIFDADFTPDQPYWWTFFAPRDDLRNELPARTDVAIIGGGYTGLTAALALARNGITATVIEAEDIGFGASTRNGGGVGGAVNVGKSLSGKRLQYQTGEREAILTESAKAFLSIESLVRDQGIACDWQSNGRFVGAWTPGHYTAQAESLDFLNTHADLGATMLPRDRQHEHLRSDLYFGGMLVERSATVNPALLYKGLLDRAIAAGTRLCGHSRVTGVTRESGGWSVTTTRGQVIAEKVIVAANGYIDPAAPNLRRRIIPVFSNIIVTEELSDGLAQHVFPTNRYVNDSPRIRSYYRLTPDGKRVLFGGRGTFGAATARDHARSLHAMMIDRLPDLRGTKVAYSWSGRIAFTLDSIPHVGEQDGLHFALGCNGSGVAMMTYLGDYLGEKVAEKSTYISKFERPLPGHPLYSGSPWFLPLLGRYFQVRDRLDRRNTPAG